MSVHSSSFSMPTGFQFDPIDEDIVLYLWNKIHKNASYAFIPDIDLYSQKPWKLPLGNSSCFRENKWYCFVRRVKSSGKKGNGKRPKRTVDGDISGGRWKATEGDKQIMSKNGQIVGYKKNLTFIPNNKDNAGGKRERTKSNWIMTEYSLASDSFQEWVLCKIRYKNSAKNSTRPIATPQIMQEQTISSTEGVLQQMTLPAGDSSVGGYQLHNQAPLVEEVPRLQPVMEHNQSVCLPDPHTADDSGSKQGFQNETLAVVEEAAVDHDDFWSELDDVLLILREDGLDSLDSATGEIPMAEAPNLPTADGQTRVPSSSSDPEDSSAKFASNTEDDWFNELSKLLGW